MRSAIVAGVAILASPISAVALQHPQPAVPLARGGDPHIQIAIYSAVEPVLVYGAVGRPLTITFGPNEHIRRVILETGGVIDNKATPPPWEGPSDEALAQQPLGNVLPLWAMRAGRSNGQVITGTEDNSNRVYQFALIALPIQSNDCPRDDCDDPRLTLGLSFIYPEERQQENRQAIAQVQRVSKKLEAEDRLKTDIFYGPRNWKYLAKGKPDAVRHLAPDEVSDNSRATAFRYLGNRPIPAFYIVGPQNEDEREVSPTPSSDMMLLYETAYHLRLRKGQEVIDLYNKGFDPIGVNPWTGTTSDAVIRVLKNASVPVK